MEKTVLILGASGRFGRNAATEFRAAGWTVRCFDRKVDDLSTAAKDAKVIVNAWNPPYADWQRQVKDLHNNVIEVAAKTGATVIVPGNVYVFGQQTPAPWGPDTPHRAKNPLGRIRIQMEDSYRLAGVRTIILRSGDFLDTEASGNWFDMVMTKSLEKGVFTYPGKADIPHAWAYLPDLARATVALAEMRDSLPDFVDLSYSGFTLSGSDMVAAINKVVQRPVRLRQMSWLPLVLLRPFWRMAACVLEMRYLWDTPHWLDGRAFQELLPDFQKTSLEAALASAVPEGSLQNEVNPDQTVAAGG